ncbi:DUF5610 domain-containing protein [Atopomonas sediminilitoris]|uniref:DUF5610 domain-containing protein n=1 Tax=Atopomonas sediminilitoris TaxID=2919919 RepID=UPI001F4E1F13|nr:DUF5610 domain-containing protein [Atopomonas sediminilitoris]MCJ8170863.1 DUF5610 domain-containing protein [Atopomonas sediminilitoris]
MFTSAFNPSQTGFSPFNPFALGRFNAPSAQAAPDVQQLLQDKLADKLADKLGLDPSKLSAPASDFSPDKVAERILGFIDQRLQQFAAAGADSDTLRQRLAEARQGVEDGLKAAKDILKDTGVFAGGVKDNFQDTAKALRQGLDQLDERYAAPVASPVASPVAEGVAVAAQQSRVSAWLETFSLNVTTAQGDKVQVRFAQGGADAQVNKVAAVAGEQGSAVSAYSASSTLRFGSFEAVIEGDINDDELAALQDLFGQVEGIAQKFYSGDLDGAFDRALALNIDGSQLSSMALRLTQSRVTQATDSYAAVGGAGSSAVNAPLADYTQSLLGALEQAQAFSDQLFAQLQGLLEGGLLQDERLSDEQVSKAGRLNETLLSGLLPTLSDSATEQAA